MTKQIHIIGGGTLFHVKRHFALCAPAYGQTAWDLFNMVMENQSFEGDVHVYTTKMAGHDYHAERIIKGKRPEAIGCHREMNLETNQDVARLLDNLVADLMPKIIFMPVAMCDFEATRLSDISSRSEEYISGIGKHAGRLQTSKNGTGYYKLELKESDKIIRRVRKERKDIFLVGFKTTAGVDSPQSQFADGLNLLKSASCNLVLANDTDTKMNMIITPEEAPYYPSKDRKMVLRNLVDMAIKRSNGHFTKTIEAVGVPIEWEGPHIPPTLKSVVDYCISKGAYKPFNDKTVGHFAFKVDDKRFVTSKRKSNFNFIRETGMVLVESMDNNRILAFGGKPSVGGQSQRIIFKEHPEMDCIVHFHCPMRGDYNENLVRGDIPIRQQLPFECGSHECGANTSEGLKIFEVYNGAKKYPVKAVMLDKHGPNIVFNKDADPAEIIKFIDKYWDLSRSTREVEVTDNA